MKLISTLLFLIPFLANAQNKVTGFVMDSITNAPIPYATVYINGTTKGTTTDDKGFFIIKDVSLSSMVVASHVSYSTSTITLKSNTVDTILFRLSPKTYLLTTVEFGDKSLRQKNIDFFKRMFLGSDNWGQNANLLNDSVLTFTVKNEYQKILLNDSIKKVISRASDKSIYEFEPDSIYVIKKKLLIFKADARGPILIDMPLLGYTLLVDLVDCTIKTIENKYFFDYVFYYNFQPYTTRNILKVKKYEHNRQLAYYNSSPHFFRSLFENQLEQNGYKIWREFVTDSITNRMSIKYLNFDSCARIIENNHIQITGLNDKSLKVFYFYYENGKPVDLTQIDIEYDIIGRPLDPHYSSEIYFLSDTCIITNEGFIPDNNIRFGGAISNKRVGAFLPHDYVLKNKK